MSNRDWTHCEICNSFRIVTWTWLTCRHCKEQWEYLVCSRCSRKQLTCPNCREAVQDLTDPERSRFRHSPRQAIRVR